jgi:hypothetical protein
VFLRPNSKPFKTESRNGGYNDIPMGWAKNGHTIIVEVQRMIRDSKREERISTHEAAEVTGSYTRRALSFPEDVTLLSH